MRLYLVAFDTMLQSAAFQSTMPSIMWIEREWGERNKKMRRADASVPLVVA